MTQKELDIIINDIRKFIKKGDLELATELYNKYGLKENNEDKVEIDLREFSKLGYELINAYVIDINS